jgi:DNA-binding GntR family transcriptional regulator
MIFSLDGNNLAGGDPIFHANSLRSTSGIVYNMPIVKRQQTLMSKASDRAYSQIRAMILSGELSPGSQIGEEQLAERCGVSRTPVRDALNRLEAELLIRRTGSQRSFVADWSLDDVEDAFTLRGMLESLAAERAAARIGSEDLVRLRWLNGAIAKAVAQDPPDITAFLDHNLVFHNIIMDAASSPRLSSMLTKLIEQPVVWRTAQNYDRNNLERSHREHEELLAAFERRDGAWAASIMAGHIRRAFHSYADAHGRSAIGEAAE